MGYERYPRGTNPQGDYYGRSETQDYGHDYGSGGSYRQTQAKSSGSCVSSDEVTTCRMLGRSCRSPMTLFLRN